MTTYVRDRYGASIEILDEESAPQIGETWDSQAVYEGDSHLKHEAYEKTQNGLKVVEKLLFKEDIYKYIKTLEKADLIEIVEQLNPEEITVLANMVEVSSAWNN
ncbi:hypothetical protein CBF34_07170 [Vagococcus penaei]|uniref:hypothetical protein n=1 Tax=Vagococcus penaei TaxID=633807 RepID=UPI000F869F01|nr:hypothetical protein [Vagococcus penaei]RSU01431.1 hypothetical protein CBF34_07170 [Vagococcus penaei]